MTFTTILAATDFSEASRNAVLRASKLASSLKAALHIVHVIQPSVLDQLRTLVSNPPQDLQQKLLAAAQFNLDELVKAVHSEYGIAASARLIEGTMPEGIETAQQETGADLTVLASRGASVARRLLLGSTAERLLAHAQHPILVVRLPAELTYRRTLVPVDFSDASFNAVQRGHALSPAARMTLLHAYEALFEGKLRTAGVDGSIVEEYRRAAESRAHSDMSAFLQRLGDAPWAQPLVVHGNPFVYTLDQEEELGSQLVVVGKGSGNRVGDFLSGSLSRRVLSQSQVDVLLSA